MLSDEGVPWRLRLAGIFSTSGAAQNRRRDAGATKTCFPTLCDFSGFSETTRNATLQL
jgi:hypothetical protein